MTRYSETPINYSRVTRVTLRDDFNMLLAIFQRRAEFHWMFRAHARAELRFINARA